MTVAVTKAACRIMERYILGDENPVEVRTCTREGGTEGGGGGEGGREGGREGEREGGRGEREGGREGGMTGRDDKASMCHNKKICM